MHSPTTKRFKKAFMAQLLRSLRAAGQASKSMSLRARRDAVRVSSDVAMALASTSARRGRGTTTTTAATAWARGLVARHAADRRNEALLRRIMGGAGYDHAVTAAAAVERSRTKEARCRRIVRRSRRALSAAGLRKKTASGGGGATVARMRVLRTLVPGADGLRGFSLLSETLDYVACLKTQVELMQCLCKGSQPRQGCGGLNSGQQSRDC